MTVGNHLDLLADLARLLKKYGPETFRSLAAALRDESMLATLGETLQALSNAPARTGRAGLKRMREPAFRDKLKALKTADPEKADLVGKLCEQLMAPSGPPASTIRAYARHAGLPQIASGDRTHVVHSFISSLIVFDSNVIRRHIERLLQESGRDPRELEGWARIILDPELRAKRGA